MTLPHGSGNLVGLPFPTAAKPRVRDIGLRANLRRATGTIRAKRASVVGEVEAIGDWEPLREAGRSIKAWTMRNLPELLERFEEKATEAGAVVHWARDAPEANRIVGDIVKAAYQREAAGEGRAERADTDDGPGSGRPNGVMSIVKVKSMATQEIGLNEALAAQGIEATETDLAELIVQLAGDQPSHILVPAIHKNRSEIRELFRDRMPGTDDSLTDEPAALAEAARRHLRAKFLSARVAVSGANFAIAETGTLVVVESEGNGRMCLTLPETLISVVGVEKILPDFRDLEVFLQLLPRSSTGERMNPYTSMWTGVTEGDGPSSVHIVLIDNGRSATLADEVGRQALHCIRCSACLNVCPVYERTGGHAYGSVYPGPIGAILSPQLTGIEANKTLPFASSLCGACYEVCPVKINIPEVLVHLRQESPKNVAEKSAMATMGWVMGSRRRYEAGLRAARMGSSPWRAKGSLKHLPWPMSGWTSSRDLPVPPKESFRDWWKREGKGQ